MTKQEILQALDELPETATVVDAIEKLYRLQPELGVKDEQAGIVLNQEEVVRRVEEWLAQFRER